MLKTPSLTRGVFQHPVKELAAGSLKAQEVIERFLESTDLGEEDVEIDEAELMKVLGEDFFREFEQALIASDSEDQKSGKRKAKRRSTN